MNEEPLERLIGQNETIIILLGRIAFEEGEIQRIVTRMKRTPDNYVKGYNACDGEHTLSEIAAIIGVTPGTLSPILKDWESQGIVFQVAGSRGKTYKKVNSI